jgi:hypothetical protein
MARKATLLRVSRLYFNKPLSYFNTFANYEKLKEG